MHYFLLLYLLSTDPEANPPVRITDYREYNSEDECTRALDRNKPALVKNEMLECSSDAIGKPRELLKKVIPSGRLK